MKIHDVDQNTPEWLEFRRGRPTGSGANRLVTPTGKASTGVEAYAIELANEIFVGSASLIEGWGGNKQTDRGHEQEPIAAAAYEFLYDVDIEVVGFCTDEEERYGISPDRLVGDDGLLEIKCLDNQGHTAAILHHKDKGKPSPDRIAQCQMQLFVSGREYVDLFYYHKVLPDYRIRILPIKTYFDMLECQLDEVIERRDEILEILRTM